LQRPANAIDFWRGFALVSIFINHIPGVFYDRFTHRNWSISDSADLFVFLAGWGLRIMAGRPEDPTPTPTLLSRIGGRVVAIYAAQIVIITIAIAMLATAARVLDNPLLLEWHNAAAVFYDPINAHIGLVLLTHQLGYFDILPLYVVLMAFAPAIVLIHRNAPNWLLPISLGIYLIALSFQISFPTWPSNDEWFFNPLAWQLVYVLGFLMARERGVGGFVRSHIVYVRWIAVPILIVMSVLVLKKWWPDPTLMPQPKLLFVLSKHYVSPPRLIQFLALIAVFSVTYPYIAQWLPRLTDFLAKLGRNSLYVFCVCSLLSLGSQIIRFVYNGSIVVDTVLVSVGIFMLWLTAWVAEWRRERQ